jgi:hypothetical protein
MDGSERIKCNASAVYGMLRTKRPHISLHKGVKWHSPTLQWRAFIIIDKVYHVIGNYLLLEEAAEAYDLIARLIPSSVLNGNKLFVYFF